MRPERSPQLTGRRFRSAHFLAGTRVCTDASAASGEGAVSVMTATNLLHGIESPEALRRLPRTSLAQVARELRASPR